jgi:hypothetical protein
MDEEWLDEGLRQFRWGLAWFRLNSIREGSQGTRSPAGDSLKQKIDQSLNSFLGPPWLPGVEQTLAALAKELDQRGWDDLPRDLPQRLKKLLHPALSGVKPVPANADANTRAGASDRLKQYFSQCVRSARGQEATLPPVPAPLVPSASGRSRFWIRQALAVNVWLDVLPSLQVEVDQRQHRLAELVRLCKETQHQAAPSPAARTLAGAVISRVRGKNSGKQLPQDIVKLLQECGQALTLVNQYLPALTTHASRAQAHVLDWIRGEMEQEPSWPPLALAQLQRDLATAGGRGLLDLVDQLGNNNRNEGEQLAGVDGLPTPVRARAYLGARLLRYLDGVEQKRPFEPAVWAAVQTFLDRLCQGQGVGLKLIRGVLGDPAWTDIRPAPAETPPVVEETGLVLWQQGTPLRLRQARLVVPPEPLPIVQSLEHLASRAGGDRMLSGLCQQIARELRQAEGPEPWWKALSPEDKGRVWQLVQRALSLHDAQEDCKQPVRELLQQFERMGLALVEPRIDPCKSASGSFRGPWFVQGDASIQAATLAPASWGQGLELRGPDGTSIAPALWFRVPLRWLKERPMLGSLAECEPLLAALKVRLPDWPEWERFTAVWQLLYTDAERADEEELARQAFLAVYKESRKRPPGPEKKGLHELARRLYICLTETLGASFTPALNRDTLDAKPVDKPPTDGTRCIWDFKDTPLGYVEEVREFSSAGKPGLVRISTGPLKPEVRRWMEMRPPVFPGLPSDPASQPNHRLTAWHHEVVRLPWYASQAEARIKHFREEFERWLGGEGQSWLNTFIQDLAKNDPPASVQLARSWWEAILAAGVRCFPSSTLPATWPENTPGSIAPGVQWEFHDKVPLRQAIGPVVFATRIEQVRGTFSLGVRRPSEVLDTAVALYDDTRARFAAVPKLMAAVETLMVQARDDCLLGRATRSQARLVLPVLDALAPLHEESQEGRALGTLLARVRGWCATDNLDVLPPRWKQGDPLPKEGQGIECVLGFSSGERGSMRLRSFGLRKATGEVIRPAVVELSAGAAPPLYEDVRAALHALPDHQGVTLAEAMTAWATTGAEADLKYPAMKLWSDFWTGLGHSFRESRREAFERVEGLLRAMLEDGFDLVAFYPESVRQYDTEWIETTRGSANATGRVRRVVRPGLHSRPSRGKPDLYLPAIVEAE